MDLPAPSAAAATAASTHAWRQLLGQAQLGFPDTRHTMQFPAAAGFSATTVTHSSDSFARSLVAELLLDCAALEPARRESARLLALREAQRLVGIAAQRADGGLSYFPDLPELPPDTDSLALAAGLAARVAPDLLPRWMPWIERAAAPLHRGEPVETWIINPHVAAPLRSAMQRGVREHWGPGRDTAVNARFMRTLLRVDAARYRPLILAFLPQLLESRRADGCWDAVWYWGTVHVTALVAELLYELDPHHPAIAEVAGALWAQQLDDGGWGLGRAQPLETGHALSVLSRSERDSPRLRRGLACLLDLQRRDGAWNGTAWIRMESGRRAGGCCAPSFGSASVASAYALRALLPWQAWLRDAEAHAAPVTPA